MIIRMRYKKLGGHYHCRVFVTHDKLPTANWAKAGDLVFDEKDFNELANKHVLIQMLEEGAINEGSAIYIETE